MATTNLKSTTAKPGVQHNVGQGTVALTARPGIQHSVGRGTTAAMAARPGIQHSVGQGTAARSGIQHSVGRGAAAAAPARPDIQHIVSREKVAATVATAARPKTASLGIQHSVGRGMAKNPLAAGSGIRHGVGRGTGIRHGVGRGAMATSARPLAARSGIQHSVVPVPATAPPRGRPAMASLGGSPAASLDARVALLAAGGPLSRTSDELRVAQTFLTQQLYGLVQPASAKFALWLTLQRDGFFRGGRSASERLSAARIGERLLQSGTLRAAPCDGMWPLVCHEIGLSYDQEERIRQSQRHVLANPDLWINRHTALATKNVVDSVHAAVAGAQEVVKRREKSLMSILKPEQWVKFLSWASRKSDVIRSVAESKFEMSSESSGEVEYKISPHRHVAANMYIIDHRLSKVSQRLPPNTSIVHPTKLKKLSRRPSFESLAGHHNELDGSQSKLNRETSFPSTGSLKRSLNDVLGSGDNANRDPSTTPESQNNAVTPESAYAAGQAAVMSAFNDILPIIPKSVLHYSPTPHYAASTYIAQNAPSSGASLSQPQAFQPAPAPVPASVPAPVKPNCQSTILTISPHYPPLKPTTACVSAPTLEPDVGEIPMPTPVSVLIRTSDDFISELPYEEPLEAIPGNSDYAIPEQASSSDGASSGTTGSGLLIKQRHQSAPQLHQSSLGSPSPDFSYSSLPAPMAMIPESSLVNNPIMGQTGSGMGDIADFALEDLPEMEADDWAIGEGFDMDVS